MDDYPSNSRKSRVSFTNSSDSLDPRVRKVITGMTEPRPQKIFSFGREERDTLLSYALREVIIPMCQKSLMDIGTNALNLLLYHNLKGSSSYSDGKRTSYTRFSDDRYNRDREDYSKDYISKRPIYTIPLPKRSQVEELICRLLDILDEEKYFSAGDLYDELQDMFPDERWVALPTYYSWGWKDLDKVKVDFSEDHYDVKFPRPVYLD